MIAQNNNRIWIIAGTVVIIAALLGGWFLGVQPQLDAMNRANSERQALVDRNDLAELELIRLKDQFAKLPELEEELAAARTSVPAISNLETFSAELRAAELASGAAVLSVNYGTAEPFIPFGEYAALVPPSVDLSKLAVIPFTIAAGGGRDSLVAFLNGVQNTPRLAVVNGVILAADGTDSWGLDITGVVYVLLEEAVAPGAAVPAAPVEEG